MVGGMGWKKDELFFFGFDDGKEGKGKKKNCKQRKKKIN